MSSRSGAIHSPMFALPLSANNGFNFNANSIRTNGVRFSLQKYSGYSQYPKNVWTGYLWPSDPEQLTPCPALYPGVIDPLIEGTRMVQASAITVMKLVLAVTFW